ncbi:MAG TPA: hypothetical protein VEH62_08320 [Gemmatimonadales bacterium]|nr:hypothetical protein [Gemmatimonadales bacterium]
MRIATAAAGLAFCLVPAALAAQGPVRVGAELSFAENANAGLGARLDMPLVPFWTRDLRLDVSFDYFFPGSSLNYWELNGDLAWGLPLARSRIALVLGGGLNLAHSSDSGVPGSGVTDLGINLLFGLRFPTGRRLTPYLELRPELGGGERFVLTAGVLF